MSTLRPVRVNHLLIGRCVPFGPNGEPSAIDKRCVTESVPVSTPGLAGDEQGDRRHHGGPDKALHHYPAEHYVTWRRELPSLPECCWRPGAFGENIGTAGLTEDNVCVGDVFRLGSALIQVSQARQPCWRLNLRFGRPDMSRLVQASARTGWYYRVLESGEIAAGMDMRLIERPHPDWPLARLLRHLYADPLERRALAAIAELDVLPKSWRQLAERRLTTGLVEDWSGRLDTPPVR
ncbi:MAG: MOSC domain-containing protein [Gammaproteobacteria bacterium]